ncbi:transcription factor bHLH128-like [Curcuma longa]|uniref:transcription factor bHLH128-like n=1 Tax=Curcuma longa TaxID=136217 RepID=UPI003D9EDF8D
MRCAYKAPIAHVRTWRAHKCEHLLAPKKRSHAGRPPAAAADADGKESGLDRYGAPSGSLLGEAEAAAPLLGRTSETSFSAPRGSYGEGGAEFSTKVSGGESALLRHSSSPAGFFSHLLMDDEIRSYPQASNDTVHPMRHLRSQWNFSRNRLSQISEMCIPEVGDSVNCSSSSDEAAGHATNSYISGNFQLSSWTDSNSVMFSAASDQRLKDNNGDRLGSFSRIDSQYSLPITSLEMSNVENYLQLQQESIPCKVRAKRGCATHPRSIAERERRNRISKRLHKLQDLVPSMDKQTSTSDMLELAIQYIKELRSQVQKLKQERADCTCTSKQLVA